jgi:hypothetical protein|tara:strand:- start:3889 stop:4104 length:216 start_codon:yes stop_codon:yes gene_type:complete
MVTIDWVSIGIGAGGIIVLGFIGWLFKPRRKQKDLHNLKKLVYETGVHTHEAYKNIKELEGLFKEMKNAKR